MRPEDISPRIKYIRKLFAPEDSLLQTVDRRIRESDFPIHIGAEEGRFLQFLIKGLGIKTIVEVGTLAAYSSIWMARALPTNGHLYTIERTKHRAELAKKNISESDVAHKITLLHGDARDELKKLSYRGPFDMIFIDADKISYTAYLDWAEENIRPGGLIVGDNTFLFEAVYLEELPEGISPTARAVLREFNQRLSDPLKYTSIMLPTQEGMTLALKK